MRIFRNVQEATRAIGANPIARKAIEILWKRYKHILLINPQEALQKARDEAEQEFVKYATDLTENFRQNTKLQEAMISDAWRQIRNQDDDEDDED